MFDTITNITFNQTITNIKLTSVVLLIANVMVRFPISSLVASIIMRSLIKLKIENMS